MYGSKTEEKRHQRIQRLAQSVKKLDNEILRLEYRKKTQAKKDQENSRYLLGRAVDAGLIVGELELGTLEPLIDKHIGKPTDRAFLRQFFGSRTETPTPLKPRPLSPVEAVIVGVTQQTYSKAERKLIYRRLYHWGVIAEAEAWQNKAWFRALLGRFILYERDRRFLGLGPL